MRVSGVVVVVILALAAAGACHEVVRFDDGACLAIAQFAPITAVMYVGDSLTIATPVEDHCPEPLVRNESPGILLLEHLSVGHFRVISRAPGAGRIHIASAVDTTVTGTAQVTVLAGGVSHATDQR